MSFHLPRTPAILSCAHCATLSSHPVQHAVPGTQHPVLHAKPSAQTLSFHLPRTPAPAQCALSSHPVLHAEPSRRTTWIVLSANVLQPPLPSLARLHLSTICIHRCTPPPHPLLQCPFCICNRPLLLHPAVNAVMSGILTTCMLTTSHDCKEFRTRRTTGHSSLQPGHRWLRHKRSAAGRRSAAPQALCS